MQLCGSLNILWHCLSLGLSSQTIERFNFSNFLNANVNHLWGSPPQSFTTVSLSFSRSLLPFLCCAVPGTSRTAQSLKSEFFTLDSTLGSCTAQNGFGVLPSRNRLQNYNPAPDVTYLIVTKYKLKRLFFYKLPIISETK